VTQLLIIFFSTLPSPSDIYTLSLHDALPICEVSVRMQRTDGRLGTLIGAAVTQDRLATRDVDYLNSTNSKAWVEVTDRNQFPGRSEEHTSELQSRGHLVCRLLLEKKKQTTLT